MCGDSEALTGEPVMPASLPTSLRDFITVRRSTYNLRGNTIVDLPKVKSTTYGLISWRYAASNLTKQERLKHIRFSRRI